MRGLAAASFTNIQSRARAQAPSGLVFFVVVVLRVVMVRNLWGETYPVNGFGRVTLSMATQLKPGNVTHLPAGPGLTLAIEMKRA